MAVKPMDRIFLSAMKRDRKAILELIQRRGLIEVAETDGGGNVFQNDDTSPSRDIFKKSLSTVCEAREILEKLAPPEDGMLAFLKGREAVTPDTIAGFYDRYNEILQVAYRIVRLQKEIAEAKAEAIRIDTAMEALHPWETLPIPHSFKGTKSTSAFIGTLEGEKSLEDVYLALAAEAPELTPLHVELVWQNKVVTCVYVVTLKKHAQEAENALRGIGFTRTLSDTSLLPSEQMQSLLEKKEASAAFVLDSGKEIESYAALRHDFKFFEDHLRIRIEKYEIIERLAQSKHTFSLSGFLPSDVSPALQKELLETFDCAVEIEAAGEPGEEVPVLLKNNWFTEPVETVLEGYSLPGKGELDPTGITSIFYYITFGLMFSDAGYGAIIFFVCLFCLLRFKNMEPSWSKYVRMFMWCGLSTVLWGAVFSSYFGDIVDVVSQSFFGVHYTIPPIWFSPMEKPMLLLVFSLAVGMIHLTVGYIMKGLTCLKQKDYIGILYDMVFPIAAWYPLAALLVGSDLFEGLAGFKVALPDIAVTACLGISALSIVGIVLTSGRESKNWFKRILKGIYALYSILSGWLSDVLSYSRLLALGLATGVIAGVMNQLGAMTGTSVMGILAFVVIFLAGQGLNFGINVLGAYVHSNRLAYVEFFGKFYDGGGRKFAPFGIHTKYFKIQEETKS